MVYTMSVIKTLSLISLAIGLVNWGGGGDSLPQDTCIVASPKVFVCMWRIEALINWHSATEEGQSWS